ncbi:MAG TPA: hypothetical protein VMU34_13475 [Mycobacterium sp.]|nr:hypothetical protein [Mycobacterium sp.]
MTSTPRDAVDLVRKLIGKAADMLGVPVAAGSLLLPASPDLQARLRREAAQHGMSLTDWAVAKLGFESGQLVAGSSSGRPPIVERWRTRC